MTSVRELSRQLKVSCKKLAELLRATINGTVHYGQPYMTEHNQIEYMFLCGSADRPSPFTIRLIFDVHVDGVKISHILVDSKKPIKRGSIKISHEGWNDSFVDPHYLLDFLNADLLTFLSTGPQDAQKVIDDLLSRRTQEWIVLANQVKNEQNPNKALQLLGQIKEIVEMQQYDLQRAISSLKESK